jgi:glycosyltransferase involved in cell wall biosynthesis
MLVTVAICTWNRSKLLDQTLAEMQKLVIPEGARWELIVVNNNSTDDTEEVLARYADKLPLMRLFEPRAGKSYAANLALEHVSGDLLIWTDDDVLAEPDWIANYLAASERWPDASFFAGAIDPWFESEPPRWIKRYITRLRGVYVIVDYGTEERLVRAGDGIYGANMAFRTSVAKQFPLNTDLGRIKGELIGADDTDLVRRVTQAGYLGVVLPNAKVRHFVPASRSNLFIVGAMKAGTSSLHEYLHQHPQIFMSRIQRAAVFCPAQDEVRHVGPGTAVARAGDRLVLAAVCRRGGRGLCGRVERQLHGPALGERL